jgi:hypothetical protein
MPTRPPPVASHGIRTRVPTRTVRVTPSLKNAAIAPQGKHRCRHIFFANTNTTAHPCPPLSTGVPRRVGVSPKRPESPSSQSPPCRVSCAPHPLRFLPVLMPQFTFFLSAQVTTKGVTLPLRRFSFRHLELALPPVCVAPERHSTASSHVLSCSCASCVASLASPSRGKGPTVGHTSGARRDVGHASLRLLSMPH